MFSKGDCAVLGCTAGMLVTYWMATKKLNMMKERLEEQEKETKEVLQRALDQMIEDDNKIRMLRAQCSRDARDIADLREQCSRDASYIADLREKRDTLADQLRAFKAQQAIKEQQRLVPVEQQEMAEAAAEALLKHFASNAMLGD